MTYTPGIRQAGARNALLVMTTINLVCYADRYVLSSIKSLIQDDLHLTDFQSSLPVLGIMLVELVCCPLFGMLNDKNLVDRRYLLCGAILFWSAATSMAGLAQSLTALVLIRSLIGVGESAYNTIVPPMLFDFYPFHERNIIMGIYYMAVPIGAALGYVVGSSLGEAYGWRVAFYVMGIPGILAALFMLCLHNPPMGINDEKDKETLSNCHTANVSMDNNDGVESGLPMVIETDSLECADSIPSALIIDGTSNHSPLHRTQPYVAMMQFNDTNSSEKNNSNNNHNDNHNSNSNNNEGISPSHEPDHFVSRFWTYLYHELTLALSEWWEILCFKPFLFAVFGMCANVFAAGGLADWLPVFMLRYLQTDVTTAGLLVGAATVIGGIGGTLLGAKVSEYFLRRVKSAYFLIPALFTLPATGLLIVTINVTSSLALTGVLLIVTQIMFWTATAPVSALGMSVVPPRLRSRSCGLMILLQHGLGDLISPPLIGFFSDYTGSLQVSLQMTWMAVLVSGAWWFAGYYFLDALPIEIMIGDVDGLEGVGVEVQEMGTGVGEEVEGNKTKITFCNVLFGGSNVDNSVVIPSSTQTEIQAC